MRIGVPAEVKPGEFRVGLTPDSVAQLVQQGHQLFVQVGAGEGIQRSNQTYQQAGATLLPTAQALYEAAQLIVKVKEPLAEECLMLREGQLLFCFLHLAPNPSLTQMLLERRVTCLAYETVTDTCGRLPILSAMSQIAGRVAVQAGAHHLEKQQGGMGLLLSGAEGVSPARVVIVGAGVAGFNAAQIALGMGAQVTVLDIAQTQLDSLAGRLSGLSASGQLQCLLSSPQVLAAQLPNADLVIGGVLVPGASAPKVISRHMIRSMRSGSVVVDIAIDQGGCVETSKPTCYEQPTFVEEGVIHFCVTNIPGAVPATASYALNKAVFPYISRLAELGLDKALVADPGFASGLNLCAGLITHPAIAEAMQQPVVESSVAIQQALQQ